MKSFLKKSYSFTVMLLQSLMSILCVSLYSKYALNKNRRAKTTKDNNKEVIILGNGPSLKPALSNHLDELKCRNNTDFVSVNQFCSSPYFTLLKPAIYVIADPGYFRESEDERLNKQKKDIVDNFLRVNWKMKLFLPYEARKSPMFSKIINNQYIHPLYYNLTPISGFNRIEFWAFRHNLGMPHAMNVLNASIFLMINQGYHNIYLLGADHSWLSEIWITEDNILMMGDQHFYGSEDLSIDTNLSNWLATQETCFASHCKLYKYAKYMNINVYNSTKGSFIDAYPRNYLFT